MSRVKLSVIVPIYNAGKTLERCIDSILDQTYREFELILVNDGSVDNSGEIMHQYCNMDERVVLIEQENKGVSAARNQGLYRARGEWIAFVDADDYLDESCFKSALSRTVKSGAELVLWNWMDVYQNRMEEKRIFYGQEDKVLSGGELIEKVFYNTEGNLEIESVYCRLFQREKIIEEKILFNEKLSRGEDIVFMLDYLENTDKVIWCNDITYFRTMRRDSALHQYNPDIEKELISFLEEMDERLKVIKGNSIRKAYNISVLRGPVTTYIECFVCNSGNQMNRKDRALQLKSFLENERVKIPLHKIRYREISNRRKIKLFCVRHTVMIVLDWWYRTKKYM